MKACEQAEEKAKGQRPQPGREKPPATCVYVGGVPRARGQPLLTLAKNPPPVGSPVLLGKKPEASAHGDHSRAARGPLPTWRPPPHQARPRLPLGALEFPGAGAPRAPPEAGHLPFRAPPSAPTPTCSGGGPSQEASTHGAHWRRPGGRARSSPQATPPPHPPGRGSPSARGLATPSRAARPGPSPPGQRWGLEAAPSRFNPHPPTERARRGGDSPVPTLQGPCGRSPRLSEAPWEVP